jgi:hypothetical protein
VNLDHLKNWPSEELTLVTVWRVEEGARAEVLFMSLMGSKMMMAFSKMPTEGVQRSGQIWDHQNFRYRVVRTC